MSNQMLSVESSSLDRLPFDARQQQALVGHAIMDDKFFIQIKDRLKPEWFLDAYVSKIFSAEVEFWNQFQRCPNGFEELQAYKALAKLNMADKLKVQALIQTCRAETAHYGLDFLCDQLTTWSKTRLFLRDMPQIANLINTEQVSKAESLLHSSSREIQVTRFDGVAPADLGNLRALVESQKLDYENALTFGHPLLDAKLNPEALGNGALLRGDTTVFIAPMNIGKTTTMISVARHNWAQGKSVLYIALEARDKDLMEKIWQSALRKTKGELRKMCLDGTEQDKKIIETVEQRFMDDFTFLHMVKVGLTVEEVISVIRTYQQRRKALKGKGYDLLVVDYPQILTSEQARGSKWEYRQTQDFIYRQFVQLDLEEKFHGLLAAQENKEGAKANDNEERLTLPTDVAECWAIAMSATNILTINRGPRAQANSRVTYYLGKSRSSETGWAVTCKSDFGRAISHAPDMSAIAYRGTGTMNDKIEGLLKNYRNCDVPEGILYGGPR